MGPGGRGHAADHRGRDGHGRPARDPRRRSTSTSTARQRRLARLIQLPRRGHDRRPVDRDGPVHLHDLGAALRDLNGFAGALALACLMLPIVIRTTRGDAAARARELREGSVRAREPQGAARSCRVVLPARRARHRRAARCSPSPAPRARPRRCCSRSAPCTRPTPTSSTARTPRCPCRSSTTRSSRLRRRPGAGLGRRADADRDRVRVHPARPASSPPSSQVEAPRMSLVDEPGADLWISRRRDPPADRRRSGREPTTLPERDRRGRVRAPRRLGVTTARTSRSRDVDLDDRGARDHRVHRTVGLRQDAPCCAA